MRHEIELLAQLQMVDDELKDVEMELGDLPEQVERLKLILEDGEKKIKQYTLESQDNKVKRDLREVEIDDYREKLGRYKEKLFLVQTNREYDAINSEIDQIQAKIDENETQVLILLSREEELKQLLEDIQQSQDTAGKEFREKNSELIRKLKETEGEKNELLHEREKVFMKMKKPVYAHYERIRNARDGSGVAKVLEGACGGCFSAIPPQKQVEILKMNDIALCETCGRYLIPNIEF